MSYSLICQISMLMPSSTPGQLTTHWLSVYPLDYFSFVSISGKLYFTLMCNLNTNEQNDKNILKTTNIASELLVFDILDVPESEISYIVILKFLTSHFSSLMLKKNVK